MNKKILFIQPTIYDDKARLIKKRRLYFVGLAYPLLAALTPNTWQCEICLETIEDIPFNTNAHVIAIGGMGHAINRAVEIAKEFKKRNKIVIAGGPMASLAPELINDFFDSIVIGDAEAIWQDVINDIESNTLKPRYEQKLSSLSTPLPRYDLILDKKIGDFLPVQAGRGCTHSCSFCSIYCLYRNQYLKRNISEVVRDITHIKSLGFKKFLLLDDNIAADSNYLKDLCEAIKPLEMKWMSQCSIEIAKNDSLLALMAQSGCTALSFGLESINQRSLDLIGKSWCRAEEYLFMLEKVRAAGIEVSTEMMIGLDADTPDSLRETVDFILKCGVVAAKFYIITPIPGTDYYNEMKSSNRIIEGDPTKLSPSKAAITHPRMTPAEITNTLWEIYNEVYTLKNILKRTILHKYFFKNPKDYFFFFLLNLYYRHQIKRGIAPIIL